MPLLVDEMPEQARPEDPVWTTAVMAYELGSVIRCLVRAEHIQLAGGAPERVKALLATARIGAADLITQVRVLSEQMGWKWIDLENDGIERFKERMTEIAEGKL